MAVKVYQIYYRPEQAPSLDPAFVPYDNTQNPNPEWREYWVFLDGFRRNKHLEADYVGFFSHRFGQKVRMASGADFVRFVEDHPGYDAYFINPFPEIPYNYKNVWRQGELNHKGLLRLSQSIMDRVGYKIDLATMAGDESITLFSNYWVGNKEFWRTYIDFTLPIYEQIHRGLPRSEEELLRTPTYYDGANYIPFIMERLFSTLLAYHPSIKALPYTYSLEQAKRYIQTQSDKLSASALTRVRTREQAFRYIDILRAEEGGLPYRSVTRIHFEAWLRGRPVLWSIARFVRPVVRPVLRLARAVCARSRSSERGA